MPNFGSNLSGQFGVANETTPGTAVAVSTFIEVNSVSLESRKNTAQGGGLRAGGSGVQRASRRSMVTEDGGGDVEMFFTTKGMGKLLQAMMGSYTTTATQISTSTAYRQIHNVGSPDGKAFTSQVGVPSTDATVNPMTYAGCKVTAWEINCASNGQAVLKLTIDSMTPGQPTGAGALGLQTASYSATSVEYGFNDILFQTFSAYTVVSGVWTPTSPVTVPLRNLSIKGGQPKKVDRWVTNSSTKAEQLVNGWQPLTGQLDIDFAAMGYFNQYIADTSIGIAVTLIGPDAGSGNPANLSIVLPATFLEQGSTPKLSGTDVNTVQYPITALDDGVNGPIQMVYISTDTTV